jgi:hypothetical protein
MKNVLKWAAIILGILIVLVLVASPFLLRSGFARMPFAGFSRMPMHPGPDGWNGMGGHPGLRMMGGFGLFGGVGMLLFRLLGNLVVLGLIVLGVVALVRYFSKRQPTALPAAPAAFSAAPVTPAPAPAPVQTQACKACGKDLQPDWSHCPYCGTAV